MELNIKGDITDLNLNIQDINDYTVKDLEKETSPTMAIIDGQFRTNFDLETPPPIDIPTEPVPTQLPKYGVNAWGLETFNDNDRLTQAEIDALVDNRSDDIFTYTHKAANGFQPNESQFRFDSGFAFVSEADPTKNFGKPGAHFHAFFGNTGINEHSTLEDLLNTTGSVNQGGVGNRTAYYGPIMLDTNGKAVIPFRCLLYYKTKQERKHLSLIPQGQGLISGNLTTGLFSPSNRLHWGFYNPHRGMVTERINHIPKTNPKGFDVFRSVVQFQDLLVKDDLGYSGAHKYSVQGEIPPEGYIQTYQLTQIFDYFWEDDTPQWHLDGDTNLNMPGHTLHAEVKFLWNEKLQKLWHDNCYRMNCSGGQINEIGNRLNDFTNMNRYYGNARIELK